jgi:hypothetical protein
MRLSEPRRSVTFGMRLVRTQRHSDWVRARAGASSCTDAGSLTHPFKMANNVIIISILIIVSPARLHSRLDTCVDSEECLVHYSYRDGCFPFSRTSPVLASTFTCQLSPRGWAYCTIQVGWFLSDNVGAVRLGNCRFFSLASPDRQSRSLGFWKRCLSP